MAFERLRSELREWGEDKERYGRGKKIIGESDRQIPKNIDEENKSAISNSGGIPLLTKQRNRRMPRNCAESGSYGGKIVLQ